MKLLSTQLVYNLYTGTQRNTEEYWVDLPWKWGIGDSDKNHYTIYSPKIILRVQRFNCMISCSLRRTITLRTMLAEVIDIQPLVQCMQELFQMWTTIVKSGTSVVILLRKVPRPQSELCCKTLKQEEPQFSWECPAAVSEWRSDYQRLISRKSYTGQVQTGAGVSVPSTLSNITSA